MPKYRESIAEFVSQGIVLVASRVRSSYGFSEALAPDIMEDDDLFDCERWQSVFRAWRCSSLLAVNQEERQAVVRNKTEVTKLMMETFLHLCLHKYLRAKIEPGARSPMAVIRMHAG